ncbi:hypothetical protein [Blautia sp.]|uniref:hypothetical protein n=1 Tax=Blautia sp. TaxID=1955243 RepID=UPI002E78371D|nr:hypothetical protein [Blautia sp.]MEE0811337.1 hypothetical protein [Blautia sp.]
MNVLEKILEEIEEMRNIMESTVATNCFGKDCEHDDCTVCVCKRAMEIIRSHMDEAKNDDWIPYTEQNIPKKEGIYLVTCDDKEYPVKRMRFKENLWYWSYGIYDGRILAWKPLPEPYRAADKPDWKENMLNTFLAGH